MVSVTFRSPGQVPVLVVHQNLEEQGVLAKTSAIARGIFSEVKPFLKVGVIAWVAIQLFQAVLLYPITVICLAVLSRVAYKNRHHIVNAYLLHVDRVNDSLGRKSWFKEVGNYQFILGKIPLENKNHAQKLKDMGVKRVISLVEKEESSTMHLLANPVSYQKFSALGIDVKELVIKDAGLLSIEELDVLVGSMEEIKAQNGKTYLYAKSTSSQTAIVAIAYLIKSEGLNAAEAIEVMKQQEPSMKLNEHALGRILSYDLHVQCKRRAPAAVN